MDDFIVAPSQCGKPLFRRRASNSSHYLVYKFSKIYETLDRAVAYIRPEAKRACPDQDEPRVKAGGGPN